MTSPFKNPPKISATCNNCDEEFTYNDTYGTGRLCQDCHDKLDDPKACEFGINAHFDAITRKIHITTTVSHNQPTKVYIPAYTVDKQTPNAETLTYNGYIADLIITTKNGTCIYETTWKKEKHHVLDPHSECDLNINSHYTVGCDGSRTWELAVNDSELAGDTDVFDYNTLHIEVTFPEITDSVPESTVSTTITIPDHLINL